MHAVMALRARKKKKKMCNSYGKCEATILIPKQSPADSESWASPSFSLTLLPGGACRISKTPLGHLIRSGGRPDML